VLGGMSALAVKLGMALTLLAVGAGALALHALGSTGKKAPFDGQPMPKLYSTAQVAQVDGPLRAAVARAHRETAAWLSEHPLRDDAAFAAWAQRAMGPPPAAAGQRRELAALHRLAATRDAAGVAAATWLEQHGKKQVWKLYGHQYRDFAPKAAGKREKRTLKTALKLAGTLQATAKNRFARPSPYVTDPTVNALNQAKFKGKTRLSYPSKHAVFSAAAVAVLRHYEASREGEYRWMADEVDFSRLYAGGHYLSDLTAGAFLGTAIGDYALQRAAA
jgi:membrane-associated phospholipid phosphatase